MNDSLAKRLTTKLTDWLIALCIASVLVWFVITQPLFLYCENDNKKPAEVDIKKLQEHVFILTEGFAPRTIEYDNLDITADYIFNEFKKFGQVGFQSFENLAGKYKNVVLSLGADTQDVLVIGAHYDAMDNSLDSEGNASGIATLIELARQLSLNINKLSTRVELIAYPISTNQSSKIAYTGSFYHAESLKKQGKNVRLMISLDSVGRYSNQQGSQKYPYKFMSLLFPDQGDYISLSGRIQDVARVRELKNSFIRSTSLPVYSLNLPVSFSQSSSIDHKNYWNQGFPAVLLTDTEQFRDVSKSTSVSESLDYKKMAKLVQGLHQVVNDMASDNKQTLLVHESSKNKDGLTLQ